MPKPKEEHEVIARALALEHDCTAAYSEAAPKASDQQLKEHFSRFAADCARHVDQWKARLEQVPDKESGISKPLNKVPPSVQHTPGCPEHVHLLPQQRCVLEQGKVKLAGLIGDKALVKAVQNNADDSSSAYQGVRAACPSAHVPMPETSV